MRLEFSAQFKDADIVASAVKRLQGELKDLGNAGSSAGQAVNSAFKSLGDNLQQLQQMSKAGGAIKELTKEIDQLSKLGTNIDAFSRSFNDLGKTVNSAIGGASINAFKQLKQSITDITKGIDEYKGKIEEIDYNLPLTRARHGEGSAEYQSMIRQKYALGASIGAAEAARREAETVAKMSAPMSETGVGRALGLTESSMLGRLTVGGALKAPGQLMGGISAGLYAGGEAMYNLGAMTTVGNIAQRRLRMQAGLEAAGGDPTQAILEATGIGAQSGGMAKAGAYASEYGKTFAGVAAVLGILASPFTGGVSGLAGAATLMSGLGKVRGLNETSAAAEARIRGLDKEAYEQSFAPALSGYLANEQTFQDMYLSRGSARANSLTTAIMRQGLSRESMAAGVNASLYYGAEAGSGADDILMLDAKRRFGISDNGLNQLARLSARGGATGAVGSLRTFLGGSAFSGDINARRTLTDYAFSQAEAISPGFTDLNQAGAVAQIGANALSGQVSANAMSAGQAAGFGVQAAQMFQSQRQNPMSLEFATDAMALMQLGVMDDQARTIIQMNISKGNIQGAIVGIQAAQKRAGRKVSDAAEITAILKRGQSDVGNLRGSMISSDAQAVAKSMGQNARGIFTTGNIAQSAVGESLEAIYAGGGAALPAPGAAIDPYAKTGAAQIEAGTASKQASEIEAIRDFITGNDKLVKDVQTSVFTAIADALARSGDEIKKKVLEGQAEADSRRSAKESSSRIVVGPNKPNTGKF